MDRMPDVLSGRLDLIAYAHIRERLLALQDDLPGMLDYVNHLFLDTRGDTRRGFDFQTAATLMDIKHDLMVRLDEFARLRDQVLHRDPQFTADTGKPVNGYAPVPLPKHW